MVLNKRNTDIDNRKKSPASSPRKSMPEISQHSRQIAKSPEGKIHDRLYNDFFLLKDKRK